MRPNAKRRPAGQRADAQNPDKDSPASVTGQLAAVGDHVRCERSTASRGTWWRYASREGVVVSVNVSRSVNPAWPDVTEIGVKFTAGVNGQADAWFLPTELVVVDRAQATSDRPPDANGVRGQS